MHDIHDIKSICSHNVFIDLKCNVKGGTKNTNLKVIN